MVNPGNALVEHVTETLYPQVVVEFAEQLDGSRCRCVLIHDESAVGQTGMRLQCVTLAVGRQQGIEAPFAVEHQRIVLEAVAMVVHVAAVEEKGAVLGTSHKAVPLVSQGRGVANN